MRFIVGLFFILAAVGLVSFASPLSFYLKPKQERLVKLWQQDIAKLQSNAEFSQAFSNLSGIEIYFTEPEVADEFENFPTPFSTQAGGTYLLKVSITRWIEPRHYGFVVQHELFDQNDNKVFEFGRTYRIGFIL